MDDDEFKLIKDQQKIERENYGIIKSTIDILSKTMSSETYYRIVESVRNYREKIYQLQIQLNDDLCKAYINKKGDILTELKKWTEDYKDIKLNITTVTPMFLNEFDFDVLCRISIKNKRYPIKQFEIMMFELSNLKTINVEKDNNNWSYNIEGRRYNGCMDIFMKKEVEGIERINFDKIKEYISGKFFIKYRKDMDLQTISNMMNIEKNAINAVNLVIENSILQYYENELQFWREMNLELIMGDVEVDYK